MEEQEEKNIKKKLNNAAKYSAIGFQMIATIGLLSFIGYKIDEYRHSKALIFTAILGIIGVGIALYQVIKDVTKEK